MKKYIYTLDNVVFEVKELNLEIAKTWDDEVQPLIDMIEGRTDSGWKWKYWYALSIIFSSILGQNAKGFCVYLYDIPVGMFFGVFSYNCKEETTGINIPTYLWLMSKNPEMNTILEMMGKRKEDIYFTEMVFDVLLKEANLNKNIQSFWLHASPVGNSPLSLLEYYKKRGLVPCKLNRRPTIRKEDGRYLYYPEGQTSNIKRVKVVKE